jgi:Protein of unknown function (DUF2878)
VTPRATTLVNYGAYQAGWFAAVLGAATGHGDAGAAVAAALIAVHLGLARERGPELALLALATLTGLVVEVWQLHAGTYRLLAGAVPANLPPAWLLALWAQFATTFRYSGRAVLARVATAMLFGALGGPLAFLAGERLGAVALTTPLWPGLARLALGWSAALVVFSWGARRAPGAAAPTYRRPWREPAGRT